MEPYELSVVDDKVEYTQEEIWELVTMIDVGNRTRSAQRSGSSGLAKVVSAFGIVGECLKLFVLCQITENENDISKWQHSK